MYQETPAKGNTAQERLRILGIAGSLRKDSLNRKLLNATRKLVPPGMEIALFDLRGIPLYNGDMDTEALCPKAVEQLKEAIREADAVLFATPEYNHSVPGVLQNAIDWASRPGGKSPLANKPVAIIGTSPGAVGTARAQQQLKLVLMSTLSLVMPHPGVLVNNAGKKFDPQGTIIDEPTRAFLISFLQDLETWIHRLAQPVEEQA